MKVWNTNADRELWETHWHLLAHRSELDAMHRYLRFEVAGEEVVAFNDGASVHVFDNRCPHRGTRIFDGTDGQQRFLCLYHGWSFAKGKWFIPGRETFPGDLAEVRLTGYESEWLGDFLFVARRPARPLAEQLEGVAAIVEGIGRSIGSRADLSTYAYQCNWKIAVENALDQYHVAVIHRDTLNQLKMDPAEDEYLGINNVSRAGVGDERMARRLRSLKRFFDIQYQSEGYIAVHLFPFTFLTATFGYSYSLQQFYPSGTQDRTHFTSRFYPARLSAKIGAEAMRSFFDSTLEVNHKVFREDAAICARQPTDSWSPEPPRFLSTGEEKVAWFRQTLGAVMRGEPPRVEAPAPALAG